jgi:UDPglucose 6-dehydrogenase
MDGYRLVVDKSTVPVGTGDDVQRVIRETLAERGITVPFDVASNPEFLKEGSAVADFTAPDRVVLGVSSDAAQERLRALYAPMNLRPEQLVVMDVRSAELAKYAANAMLATRISFMNEMANLAELLNADIDQVRRVLATDPRIGPHFIQPGCGYGGSCFPKDVKALIHAAGEHGVALGVLQAVEAANERQKHVLVDKIVERFGDDLTGRTFALWGLAFKPNTDDMREAPSRVIVAELARRGAAVQAYDPVAMDEARKVLGGTPGLTFVDSQKQALEGADALVIATEWKEFRNPDFEHIKAVLKQPVVFDGRNLYEPALMKTFGIEYRAIGRSGA